MDRDLADADDRMGCVTLPLAAALAGPHAFNEPVVLDSVPHGTLAGKMAVRASLPALRDRKHSERSRTRLKHGDSRRNCTFSVVRRPFPRLQVQWPRAADSVESRAPSTPTAHEGCRCTVQ
jgi:hypothetical protein